MASDIQSQATITNSNTAYGLTDLEPIDSIVSVLVGDLSLR